LPGRIHQINYYYRNWHSSDRWEVTTLLRLLDSLDHKKSKCGTRARDRLWPASFCSVIFFLLHRKFARLRARKSCENMRGMQPITHYNVTSCYVLLAWLQYHDPTSLAFNAEATSNTSVNYVNDSFLCHEEWIIASEKCQLRRNHDHRKMMRSHGSPMCKNKICRQKFTEVPG